MTDSVSIEAADEWDLQAVCELLGDAREWHMRNTPEVWPVFEASSLAKDIEAGRVFIAREAAGRRPIGTVTLTDADPLIWDADVPAIYVHKLTVRSEMRGRSVGAHILRWIEVRAGTQAKTALRLDTWASNLRIQQYYVRHGFEAVRTRAFPPDSPLPPHYRGASMILMQKIFSGAT